jgi:hypothetical protein
MQRTDSRTISRPTTPVTLNERRAGRKLRELLKNEARIQHRLLAIATDMREAIIERDINALAALETLHCQTPAEAEAAAAARREMSRAIAADYESPVATGEPTLSHVLRLLPGEVAVEIGLTATLLLEVVRDVRSAHTLNRDLLENELEHIGISLEVIARAAAPRQDYTRRLPAVSAAALMLDRAA